MTTKKLKKKRVSVCNPRWPGSYYVHWAGLELTESWLSQPLNCWVVCCHICLVVLRQGLIEPEQTPNSLCSQGWS